VVVRRTVFAGSDTSRLHYGSLDAFLDQDVEFYAKTLRILQHAPMSGDGVNLCFCESAGVFTQQLQPFGVVY
jgi:hypothetical protein